MSDHTKIEWTDATWNPVRGCTKITPGCTHCYAETFAERFRGVPGHPYEQGFDLRLVPEKLRRAAFAGRRRKMVFVNSMSDLFHEDVPDEYILRVANVMAAANWHTYQVLTKRSERMAELLRTKLRVRGRPAAHLVGRERREPEARPAADRSPPHRTGRRAVPLGRAASRRPGPRGPERHPLGDRRRRERPRRPADARRLGPLLRDQCQAAGVRFFFKQWGGVQKSKTGRELDRRTHDEQPGVEEVEMPGRRFRLELAEEYKGCTVE